MEASCCASLGSEAWAHLRPSNGLPPTEGWLGQPCLWLGVEPLAWAWRWVAGNRLAVMQSLCLQRHCKIYFFESSWDSSPPRCSKPFVYLGDRTGILGQLILITQSEDYWSEAADLFPASKVLSLTPPRSLSTLPDALPPSQDTATGQQSTKPALPAKSG